MDKNGCFFNPSSAPMHTVAAMDFGILALVAYGLEFTTDARPSGSRFATNDYIKASRIVAVIY
jgi:hypothetical protein